MIEKMDDFFTNRIDNYENQMEMAYSALIEFMKQYQLETVTPIYHVVDKEQRYIKVMIGYKNILQE